MICDSRRHSADQPRPRFVSRGRLGTALAVVGAAMLFLGWYGVSGTATVGEQLPYLASGSLPGAALVIAAAIVLMGESTQRSSSRTESLVSELHSLLVEAVSAEITSASESSTAAETTPMNANETVALASGELFHRGDCLLVSGKPDLEVADAATIDRRHLAACPVCEPERPAA